MANNTKNNFYRLKVAALLTLLLLASQKLAESQSQSLVNGSRVNLRIILSR